MWNHGRGRTGSAWGACAHYFFWKHVNIAFPTFAMCSTLVPLHYLTPSATPDLKNNAQMHKGLHTCKTTSQWTYTLHLSLYLYRFHHWAHTWSVLGLNLEPGCKAPHPEAQPLRPCISMLLGGKHRGLIWGAMSTLRFSRTTATSKRSAWGVNLK